MCTPEINTTWYFIYILIKTLKQKEQFNLTIIRNTCKSQFPGCCTVTLSPLLSMFWGSRKHILPRYLISPINIYIFHTVNLYHLSNFYRRQWSYQKWKVSLKFILYAAKIISLFDIFFLKDLKNLALFPTTPCTLLCIAFYWKNMHITDK